MNSAITLLNVYKKEGTIPSILIFTIFGNWFKNIWGFVRHMDYHATVYNNMYNTCTSCLPQCLIPHMIIFTQKKEIHNIFHMFKQLHFMPFYSWLSSYGFAHCQVVNFYVIWTLVELYHWQLYHIFFSV